MEKMNDDVAAQIAGALADRTDWRSIQILSGTKKLFCSEMHCKHPISGASLSHHLKVLMDPRLTT